jgi:hypothetical protein
LGCRREKLVNEGILGPSQDSNVEVRQPEKTGAVGGAAVR